MSRLSRFGSALSVIAVASVVGGCAGPMSRQSATAAKINKSDVGLATRAHAAMTVGNYSMAVELAERAVENEPQAPMLRALLGNVYFASGRFASAETAFRDSLAIGPDDPQVVLKLALVQIAQGKSGEALALLGSARGILDPANYGLALALAGQPNEAIAVLEPAARRVGADARVRQNLALAYGLSGDWLAARTIASQDVSASLVDQRVHQWMAFANPVRASDQVATLMGVSPAAADPGQPVRLALQDNGTRLAMLEQAPPATAQMEPVSVPAAAAYSPLPAAEVVDEDYQAPPMAAAFQAPPAEEVVAAAVPTVVMAEPAAPPPLIAALAPTVEAPKLAVARKPAKAANGKADVVVQLGAFSSRSRVEAAWEQFSGRHDSLLQYTPTSARFDSSKGTVYRLSVKGFSNLAEASDLCASLKQQGKSCFVRRVAGDSPVQFASR